MLSGNQNVLSGNLNLILVARHGNRVSKRMRNPVYTLHIAYSIFKYTCPCSPLEQLTCLLKNIYIYIYIYKYTVFNPECVLCVLTHSVHQKTHCFGNECVFSTQFFSINNALILTECVFFFLSNIRIFICITPCLCISLGK